MRPWNPPPITRTTAPSTRPARRAEWIAQASGSAMAATAGSMPSGSGWTLRATMRAGTSSRSAKAPVR